MEYDIVNGIRNEQADKEKPADASAQPGLHENGPNYEEKIEALRARLEKESSDVAIKIALAEALFRSAIHPPKEPVEELKRLNEAIGLDPFRPAFYYHRGLQWHRVGNLERALTNYGRAKQLNPDNARVIHQMALAHVDAGRFEDARQKWDEAEEIIKKKRREDATNDTDADEQKSQDGRWKRALFVVQCGRAEAALREDKADEALKCLEKANPPPGCAALVGEMALKYLVITGAAKTVREWLQKKLEPDEREKVLERLNPFLDAYEPANDNAFPFNASDESVSRHVQVLRAVVAFDWARQQGFDGHGGLLALKQLIEEYPDDETLVHAYLALLHQDAEQSYEAGQWGQAATHWRQALQLDPYNPGIALNLALVATRSKIEKDYKKWWDRAQRLWYTRLFILPESKTYQQLIADKHLAFAIKAKELAGAPDYNGDRLEALSLWVDEMERYFLVEQYGFRSAYYLLGVALNARQEILDEAYQGIKAKTESYSDNALSTLKNDALKDARLKKLEQAYEAVGTKKARQAYKDPQDHDELIHAQLLRDRKATHLIAVSDFLEKHGESLPVDRADDYARIVERLLAHPYKALQNQFKGAGKADSQTEASVYMRNSLATYYVRHLFELLRKIHHIGSPEYEQAERLLDHLRTLNPRYWETLFEWAQIERAMGSEGEAVKRAREALDGCPYAQPRSVIKQFIGETTENADAYAINLYLNPAIEHMNNEEWKEAIPLLKEALARRPNMPILHLYMARCLVQEEQFKAAHEHVGLGEPYADTDDLRKAFADLKRIIADAEVAPFNEKASACMERQDWSGALKHLDAANKVNANHALIHARRANCLLALALEAIREGSKPPSKQSVANVPKALKKARNCPNADHFMGLIESVEQQLGKVEDQLE